MFYLKIFVVKFQNNFYPFQCWKYCVKKILKGFRKIKKLVYDQNFGGKMQYWSHLWSKIIYFRQIRQKNYLEFQNFPYFWKCVWNFSTNFWRSTRSSTQFSTAASAKCSSAFCNATIWAVGTGGRGAKNCCSPVGKPNGTAGPKAERKI